VWLCPLADVREQGKGVVQEGGASGSVSAVPV
jgi:hypothetical protein